jgi:hypothetical protein
VTPQKGWPIHSNRLLQEQFFLKNKMTKYFSSRRGNFTGIWQKEKNDFVNSSRCHWYSMLGTARPMQSPAPFANIKSRRSNYIHTFCKLTGQTHKSAKTSCS